MTGTYAFPWYLNTGPLFYNKSLFKQAGLDPDQPPKTYDETLRRRPPAGAEDRRQGRDPRERAHRRDFGRYGVQLMNKAGTAFAFNDAKGVELLTKYKELYDAKALDAQALTATPSRPARSSSPEPSP